jgi:tetratricopeptide (TPR) repeat protein
MILLLSIALATQPKEEYPALRQRLQRGNYAEARAGYQSLVKEKNPARAAFVGLAHSLRAEGKYSDALEALDAGLKAHPDDPTLLAWRADLFFFLGRWDDAAQDVDRAIKKEDGNLLGRWVRVRLLRDKGDLPAADREVRWFVKTYSEASAAGKDIVDADSLVLIARAGVENARWNNKPSQFAFILNEVLKDALKADPDCWQAEVEAGYLLLEKHNRADAADAFDKALKINARCVEALVGKGLLALAELDSPSAGRLADLALAVNPKSPEALRLKADARLAEGDTESAQRLLLAAKLLNPRSEATLARLAALHILARKPEAAAAIEKEVSVFCARPGVFYLQLAETLGDRRQFDRAEEAYKAAMKVRPDLARARAGLGLLHMQLGREPEAKHELEAAFKADPYHVRVSNALKVLRHLDSYETRETPHFAIKFDPRSDRVLAAWLADYLEDLHGEFARMYGFAPPGKILVEVLTSREMFSGRVLSLPGLPGVAGGASTGPLIVLPSPRADGKPRNFNWAVVARHELTHVFNLTQTGFLVPIWLTEGLAVRAEGTRRFDGARNLLSQRLADGTLFTLDTIAHGYHNFGNPEDVMVAYNQGFQYVRFIESAHGEEAIAKLLDSFRLGMSVDDAIRRSCGVEKATFETRYRVHLRALLKDCPRMEKPLTYAELQVAHKEAPNDSGIAARLASEYARRGKPAEARKLVNAVLAGEKGHPAASLVKARLLERDKDWGGARKVLEEAAQANPDDCRVLDALGRLQMANKEYDMAITTFESLRARPGAETDVLETLAQLYTDLKRLDRLVPVLEELAHRQPDQLALRMRLAQIHSNGGRPDVAEFWAREALFVDVTNEDARSLLLAALRAQKKDAEVQKVEARFR